MDGGKGRQLRSVDSNLHSTLLEQQPDTDLFDFEPYLTEKISADVPVFVAGGGDQQAVDYDAYLHANADLVEHDVAALARSRGVRDLADTGTTRRRAKRTHAVKQARAHVGTDPLDDALYAQFHGKMEKEEKRMANLDKNAAASEYAKFCEQLASLNVDKYRRILARDDAADRADALHAFLTNPFDDIPRKLAAITRVHDPRDYAEVKIKYKLTVKELADFGHKHLKLKKLEPELKSVCVDDSDDDGDGDLSADELRRKRAAARSAKLGPIWKVVFYDCVLYIDPVRPPQIRSV